MKLSIPITNFLLSVVFLFSDHDVSAFHVVRRCPARQLCQPTTGMPPPLTTYPSATISQSTALHNMFGGLFGGSSSSKLALDEPVTVYSASSADEFEGLGDYISTWANNMFVNGSIKLTTPVVLEAVSSENTRGIRLLFKDANTGYKNKNEESESGKARPPSSDETKKKKKENTKLQGGVQIVVEKTAGSDVQVLARRCETDEDTVIKEMSEETIMSELRQAIDIWKRQK
jgi:hypothetical protein